MTFLSNIHTHTTWCDGANTPAEMAEAALALGFTSLGFSSHSPAPFDPMCPGVADEAAYRADIAALKARYAGRLSILCGMEQDTYAPVARANYDYIIGSNHFLPYDGTYVAVDSTPENVLAARNGRYGGNGLALARDFYDLSVESVAKHRPDVVGHYDLVAKYNRANALFDEDAPAYRAAALAAMDAVADTVLDYGGMVEVNTGAMARGLRSVPYPAPFLLRHLAHRHVRVIVTSDSHATGTLHAYFAEMGALLAKCGFRSVAVLEGEKFVDKLLP